MQLAQRLYSHSLGLSVDWMRALAEALSVHFPQFVHEPYFEDCFSQRVEERHAEEALTITQMVLRQRPELLDETIRDAKMMTEVLSIIHHCPIIDKGDVTASSGRPWIWFGGVILQERSR